jgi:hypothetical protein
MQASNQKRYYTPRFSALAAVSVRRLAWSVGKPMPATVDLMVKLVSSFVEPKKVCLSCKDNTRCVDCSFYNPPTPEQRASILASIGL